MHFTPNYIGSTFKSLKKLSINRYLMNVRLEKAIDLLRAGNLQISEIAIQCGYENANYFHTVFKKERGVTPNEYRQHLKTNV